MHSISKISKNGTYLQVIWDDGKESKFNYMWLRDNCPTAHDKDSRHRMFNILDVSKEITIKDTLSMQKRHIEFTDSEDDDLANKSVKEFSPLLNVPVIFDIVIDGADASVLVSSESYTACTL